MSAIESLRFVTAPQLEEINGAGGLAVVAFLATWNQRCQDFAETYRAFAQQRGATLPVVCVDVDESSPLAAAFSIFGVPTILLLRAGREEFREEGLDLARLGERLDAAR